MTKVTKREFDEMVKEKFITNKKMIDEEYVMAGKCHVYVQDKIYNKYMKSKNRQ